MTDGKLEPKYEDDLKKYLKLKIVEKLIDRSPNIEVASYKGKYYCLKCFDDGFGDKRKAVELVSVRDRAYVFHCPYCSSVKIYQQ